MLVGLMLLSFVLSLFLGAGALFIISWDLSALVVSGLPGHIGFLTYLPMMFALFLTGLAGSLLSFAIIRHEWRGKGFFIVLRDSMILLAISLALMISSVCV
jgi:hypothetical protein